MGDRIGDDADLRAFLRTLDPHGRDTLRRVLTRDQPDRDANLLTHDAPTLLSSCVRAIVQLLSLRGLCQRSGGLAQVANLAHVRPLYLLSHQVKGGSTDSELETPQPMDRSGYSSADSPSCT